MKNTLMSMMIMLMISPFFIQPQTSKVEVTINGIENTKGNIEIGIYNSESTFPEYGKEFKGATIKPTDSKVVKYTFNDLPDGTYAIAAWHDENSNKELDKNLFGAPKEKYGFSKNKYGTFGPPDFEIVSFKVENGKAISLKITLE